MPSRSSQQIRKVERSSLGDFDDQLWPVNVAIVILGGIVAGVVFATSNFDDPRILYNGWARLGGVGAAMGVLFWAVFGLQGKMLRRVQLCVVISLLIHVGLALFLHEKYLAFLAELDSSGSQFSSLQRELITVPDYHWEQIEQPDTPQSFEEPVEVPTPDHSRREPAQPQPVQTPVRPQDLQTEHRLPEQRQATPAELRRTETLTAPRRADSLSGATISRQESQRRPAPAEPQAQPEVKANQPELSRSMQSAAAEADRRAESPAQPEISQRASAELPAPAAQPSARRARQAEASPENRTDRRVAGRTSPTAQLSRPPETLPETGLAAAQPENRPRPDARPAQLQKSSESAAQALQPLTASGEPAGAAAATASARTAARRAQPLEQAPAAGHVAASQRGSPARADTGVQLPSHAADNGAMPAAAGAAPPGAIARASSAAAERAATSAPSLGATAGTGSAEPALGSGVPSRSASAARRAVASQETPDAAGALPGALATLARASRGLDLPAAMAPEQPTVPGASGSSEAPPAVASRLEPGSAGGDQAAHVAQTVGQIPAQALAGAGNRTGGTLHQAVVAAAWLDRPDRGSAAPGEPSVGSGRLARAAGLPAVAAPPAEPSGLETATAPSGELAAAATGVAAEAARADSHRRSTGFDSGLPVGMASGPSSDPTSAAVASGGLPRAANGAASSGPEVAEVGGAAIERRQHAGTLPGSPGPVEDVPAAALAASGPAETGGTPRKGVPGADGEAARRSGGLPVQIAALAGPGGLSYDPAAMLGVPNRHARPESEVVHPIARRFVVERSAGDLSMEGRLREMSKEAFRERDPDTRGQTARARGGSDATERAVEMGLDFLARHQFPDGHWSLDRTAASGAGGPDWGAGQMNADTAGTGLSLLAFLGAGYTHREEKYRTVVRNGLDWLIANQQADGRLFTERTDQTLFGRMYGHGIATIALCEAYGMTKDPELRGPAQRAVQFILAAQHPTQGGWRYEPRLESDTSVSGWQLMALRSAQMAGLDVASENLRKVGRWLDLAQAAGGSRYRYNPYAADTPEQRQGRQPNRTMTAEGLLMRMYLGWERENPSLVEGAEFLKSNLPEVGTRTQPLRDAYYWYYATQVMFHMQGDHWAVWNGRLRPLLESSQVAEGPLAGSWDPQAPIPDRWSPAAGRLYVTTLSLLMLEVYYRHLPLYQTLAE